MVLNWIEQTKAKPVLDKILQQIELPDILKQQQIKKLKGQVDGMLTRGLRLLRGDLLEQAGNELLLAYEKLPEYFAEEIEPVFNDYLQKEDDEKALLIGLIILKVKTDDYRLANTLGNCSRRLKKYKQANNLYRIALRANKDFNLAFYNFAASLAKVEKFDLEIQALVEKYIFSEQFFLPGFLPGSQVIDGLIEALTQQNMRQQLEEVQQLIKEENNLELSGDLVAAAKVEEKIVERQKRGNEPGYKQVVAVLKFRAKKAEMDFDTSETEFENRTWQHQIYNLGLFAFQNDDVPLAQKCFKELKNEQSKLPYIKMMNALVYELNGKRDEAIADLSELVKQNSKDRFVNINLGLLYQRANNRLLAYKYLLTSASLLEKSEGLFSLDEIFQLAEEALRQGGLKRSLNLFHLIVEESNNTEAWAKIGDIYWQMLEHEEAIKAYKEIIKIDPESKLGYRKLRKIHDDYCQKATDFANDSKFNLAVLEYEKALGVLRVTETLKKASDAYKVVLKKAISLNLRMEYQEAVAKERREKQEAQRVRLIEKGKEYLKTKKIQQAIRCFENAFDMKADKDVLMFLAYLYKNLNRREALDHLLKRWHKMVKHDIKLKRIKVE